MSRAASFPGIPMPMLLLHAGAAYAAAMRDALAAAGYDDIPKNGLHVIGGLAWRAQPCPLSELILELKLSKQATGQLADALVNGAYLARHADPADRRRLTVALTEKGRAAAKVLTAARKAVDARLLSLVGPLDLERTRRTLLQLGDIGRAAAKDRNQEAS